MLGSAKAGLKRLGGVGLVPKELVKQTVRYKSEAPRQVDDFPYKYLSQKDVSSMSAAMDSTTRLPLRSFFAQHRPLMPFAKPAVAKSQANDIDEQVRWTYVSTPNDNTPFFIGDGRSGWDLVPENVANQVGPFNREAFMRSKIHDLENGSVNVGRNIIREKTDAPVSEMFTATEMQSVLEQKFPILMQHLQKMAHTDGEIKVIPLTLEKISDVHEDGIEATSVRRKRKLKMNRHKYRKRLKEQRTKRRRLGK